MIGDSTLAVEMDTYWCSESYGTEHSPKGRTYIARGFAVAQEHDPTGSSGLTAQELLLEPKLLLSRAVLVY